MSTVRVDAILFQSRHPKALARFYQEAFELGEAKHLGDEHLGLRVENTYLGFDRVAETPAGGGQVQVWFKVTDVAASFDRLQQLGATVKAAPDAECSPGEVLAQLYDPDGNVVGLIGPPSATG